MSPAWFIVTFALMAVALQGVGFLASKGVEVVIPGMGFPAQVMLFLAMLWAAWRVTVGVGEAFFRPQTPAELRDKT